MKKMHEMNALSTIAIASTLALGVTYLFSNIIQYSDTRTYFNSIKSERDSIVQIAQTYGMTDSLEKKIAEKDSLMINATDKLFNANVFDAIGYMFNRTNSDVYNAIKKDASNKDSGKK